MNAAQPVKYVGCVFIYFRNENVKVLITTGDGKFYSNGIDLEWLTKTAGTNPESTESFVAEFRKLMQRILIFPAITVAALNGMYYKT